jgi:hypothetical protein
VDQALGQAVELRRRIRRVLAGGAYLVAVVVEVLTATDNSFAVVVEPRGTVGWVQAVFERRANARRAANHINRIVRYEYHHTPRLTVLPGSAEQPVPGPAPRLMLVVGGD